MLPWWILVSENAAGEWSAGDALRDHRICHHNHERHRGTHLHHPLDGPAVDVARFEYTTVVIRRYAERHAKYDERKLKEVMDPWKST